jgi:hypothetical protein
MSAREIRPDDFDPPGHLWRDFFWMPVVEPHAIGEPFPAAGKMIRRIRTPLRPTWGPRI